MNRYWVVAVVVSLFLSGCGKNEEPKVEEQAGSEAMQPAPESPMKSEPATQTMAEEAAPMAETPVEQAVSEAKETMAEMTPAPAETTAEITMAQTDNGMGKQTYDQICFACHAQGVAGAPKIGDKAAWAPRIAKGMETLAGHAINGFQGSSGVMPPKGGMPALSDEQVKAAVAYMVGQSQ